MNERESQEQVHQAVSTSSGPTGSLTSQTVGGNTAAPTEVDAPLPRPFCGEAVDLQMHAYADDAFLQCHECTTCGPDGGDPAGAIEKWNHRALHAPSGMADPDYARFFTKSRVVAWQYGFALIAHGSFTRDLDLLLVPWQERANEKMATRLINQIALHSNMTVKNDEPKLMPHGRTAYTLLFPPDANGIHDPRWVDLSVMPCQQPIQPQGAASPLGARLDVENAEGTLASSGSNDPVWCGCGDGIMPDTGAKCGTCAAIAEMHAEDRDAGLLLQAVEALEKSEQYGAGSWPNLIAALRLRIGRE